MEMGSENIQKKIEEEKCSNLIINKILMFIFGELYSE